MALQSPSNKSHAKSRAVWRWLFYLGALLALVATIVWATLNEAGRNAARDATTELGPYGLVTIRFSTSPSPPLPTGPVRLSFMSMDARRRSVALDEVTFEFGQEGDDQPVGTGQALPMSDGNGTYMGSATFPSVGNWWLTVHLRKTNVESEVRFTFYVEPAQ